MKQQRGTVGALIAAVVVIGASPGIAEGARSASQMAKDRALRECANRERARRGIAPLEYDAALAKAARVQARDMSHHRYVGHTDRSGRSPDERVALFTQRFGQAIGENAAGLYASAKATCRGWMTSPGHRRNILDPQYTHIGTSWSTASRFNAAVQVFGIEQPTEPPADPWFDEPAPAEPATDPAVSEEPGW